MSETNHGAARTMLRTWLQEDGTAEQRIKELEAENAALRAEWYHSRIPEHERLTALQRAVWFFKTAAADPSLSDAQVRDIVRFLSAEPLTTRDIERTHELAERFGWERARLAPEAERKARHE